MLVIRDRIHKMLVIIANREDPDQTASLLHCLPRPFWKAANVRDFRTFNIVEVYSIDLSCTYTCFT